MFTPFYRLVFYAVCSIIRRRASTASAVQPDPVFDGCGFMPTLRKLCLIAPSSIVAASSCASILRMWMQDLMLSHCENVEQTVGLPRGLILPAHVPQRW
jgi:hypothetical protein